MLMNFNACECKYILMRLRSTQATLCIQCFKDQHLIMCLNTPPPPPCYSVIQYNISIYNQTHPVHPTHIPPWSLQVDIREGIFIPSLLILQTALLLCFGW